MARRAPHRPDHGAAAEQNPDRGSEQRKAVDEIRRAVDRIDGPDEIPAASGFLVHFLADDVVLRETVGELRAQQYLHLMVHLGHRIFEFGQRCCLALVANREGLPERGDDLGAPDSREIDRDRFDSAQEVFRDVRGSGSRVAHFFLPDGDGAAGTRIRTDCPEYSASSRVGLRCDSKKSSSTRNGACCHATSTARAFRSFSGEGEPSLRRSQSIISSLSPSPRLMTSSIPSPGSPPVDSAIPGPIWVMLSMSINRNSPFTAFPSIF